MSHPCPSFVSCAKINWIITYYYTYFISFPWAPATCVTWSGTTILYIRGPVTADSPQLVLILRTTSSQQPILILSSIARTGPQFWHTKRTETHSGPLHTWAKEPWPWNRESPKESRVHKPLQHHVVWSRILKCNVKSYVIGPSTKHYFDEFLLMRGPHAW